MAIKKQQIAQHIVSCDKCGVEMGRALGNESYAYVCHAHDWGDYDPSSPVRVVTLGTETDVTLDDNEHLCAECVIAAKPRVFFSHKGVEYSVAVGDRVRWGYTFLNELWGSEVYEHEGRVLDVNEHIACAGPERTEKQCVDGDIVAVTENTNRTDGSDSWMVSLDELDAPEGSYRWSRIITEITPCTCGKTPRPITMSGMVSAAFVQVVCEDCRRYSMPIAATEAAAIVHWNEGRIETDRKE